MTCPGASYSALLQRRDCEDKNLMGERLCGQHLQEAGEKPFLGHGASYPGMQDLCISSSVPLSSYWQCSQWKRGVEEVGKIQLLTQMFQAQHKRAPGFPTCREEKAYLTLLFFTSKQHAARPLPAAHTERKRWETAQALTPPSAMQEKRLPKHEAADLVNILRFQCPAMSMICFK